MNNFEADLRQKTEAVEKLIAAYLPAEKGFQKTVLEAMNYSVLAGGKRLRPILMQETFRMMGGEGNLVEPFMAAIEMIHTYSLVHDDLPAMDNDEYRRGKYTTWKKYGEGMGVLAGDALLNYAVETALRAFSFCVNEEQTKRVIKALGILFQKAGIYGMIGGQTADVETEKSQGVVTLEKLLFIHGYKTAALLEASMMTGAILAGACEEETEMIRECAYYLGIAFQIRDDILDVTGNEKELGKSVGSDAQNHKQTYVTLKGLETAEEDTKTYSQRAISILEELDGDSAFLRWLFEKLVDRKK